MSPLSKSLLCWIGGGIAGAVVFPALFGKKKPVAGAVLGALLVGGIGDKIIENNDPNYTG